MSVGTLCELCANAYSGCSWSADFKPVEGWDAIRNDILLHTNERTESYIVLHCPEFVCEEHRKKEFAKYDPEELIQRYKNRMAFYGRETDCQSDA